MKKQLLLISLLFSALFDVAQTFEMEQIEQLFRPRMRFDSKYIFDSPQSNGNLKFEQKEANAVFTFPIRTKLNADIKLDLSSIKLKDILMNSVRIKASQTLGMFRVNVKQVYFGIDSAYHRNLVNATGGVMGVHLTRKYRIMFYSVNASLAEQDKTINTPGVRASGLIGQFHLRGLRKNFFYGVAATYSDGLFIPAPFFGGSQPIGRNFIFNYTLPVQLNIEYKDDRRTLVTLGVTAEGYRTGINFLLRRTNMNYTSGSAYMSLRYKFTNTLAARIEGGYIFYQNVQFDYNPVYDRNINLGPGPYVQAGFNVLFGRSLWEKIAEGLIKN